MYKRIAILLSIFTLILTACSRAAPYAPSGPAIEYPGVREEVALATVAPMLDRSAVSSVGGEAVQVERIVIQNASLTITVDDPAKSMDVVRKMANEMGGFVVSANLFQTSTSAGEQVHQATVTIRVPAERLDEALERIKQETKLPVISQNIDSQDVTADYVDQQSRLRNLEAEEQQLLEIMDSAIKTEDVLAVFNQVSAVRQEIEVTKGRIKYYDEASALSSITVDLQPSAAEQEISIGGWEPLGVVKDAFQALIVVFQFFVNAGIWIVILVIPVLVVLALPFVVIFLVVRRMRRYVVKAPPAPPAAPAAH